MHPSAVTHNPATGKSYTYDANGNMLTRGNQTLTWDIENRVTSVAASGGGATLMEYDYTGMRVKKNAPAGITLFPFKGIEIDPSGTFTKFIRIGAETIAAKKRTSGGAISYSFYHNDHLGGVNVITSGSGNRCQLNEYDPWGGVSRSEGATPGSQPACDATHRFTGQELDPETGLYYYGGRYYDQEVGRFASPDPFVQSPDMPQNLNRYSYVLNNPQGYVDPSGYMALPEPVTLLALAAWGRFFYDLGDLFGLGDLKKIRPKAKQKSAPQPQNEVTNKNGPEPSKNVSVYETHTHTPSHESFRPYKMTFVDGGSDNTPWWTRWCIACDLYAQNSARWPLNEGRTRRRWPFDGVQLGIQGQLIASGILKDAYQGSVGVYIGNGEWGVYYSYSTSGEGWIAGVGGTFSGYSGLNPAGIANNFQAQLGLGLGYAYDDAINILAPTLGYGGAGAGIAWTRDKTVAICLLFCGPR